MEEMKKSIYRYEQEMKTVVKAKESAETKAAKYYHSYQYGENDISSLKDTLASKEIEIRVSMRAFFFQFKNLFHIYNFY